MTKAQRNQVKMMLSDGASPVAVANELRVPVADVIAVQRGALGRAADAAPQVERPALPPGKARSQASIDIAAAAAMQAEVTRRARRTRRSFL